MDGVSISFGVVKSLLRGEEVGHVVDAEARHVAARANGMARQSGWGMEADPYVSRVSKGLGVVSTRHIPNSRNAAEAENARNNTLKKALGV